MAPKPPSSDDQKPAAADDPVAPELDEELVGKRAGKLAVDAGAKGRVVGDTTTLTDPTVLSDIKRQYEETES